MSPGDLGQLVKPFVFLDLFEAPQFHGRGFAPHPHSGIATLTTLLEGSTTYADSTGEAGLLSSGAVEWMRAGRGVWHAGDPGEGRAVRGYQLWLALPPELELAPAESLYLDPRHIQGDGPVRVLIGSYRGMTSPIPSPSPITYLHVRLIDGERWTYQPNAEHNVAWLATNSGKVDVSGVVLEREMVVFEEGSGAIELVAESEVELVIGSAAKHPFPLVSGSCSIHTSPEALARGEHTIAELAHSPAVIALHRR
jgi:redox-sensitive bicupin YhaK (pirin superfamily)